MKNISQNIIGLKKFRENVDNYISEVKKGKSFIIVKKSKPAFKISAPYEDIEIWEPVIDLTKIKKGGINIKELLSRL